MADLLGQSPLPSSLLGGGGGGASAFATEGGGALVHTATESIVTCITSAATSVLRSTVAPTMTASLISSPLSSVPAFFGRLILAVLKLIPTTLFFFLTFTGLTVPTWLFTLFSTSLTFTMNFTTL